MVDVGHNSQQVKRGSVLDDGPVKNGLHGIVWRLIFYFTLSVVMVFALLPTSGAPGFPGQDKLMHLIVFSVLFMLGAKGHPGLVSRRWLYLYLGLFFYGMLMEFLQGQTSYRSMEAWDLVADSLGLIVGHCFLIFCSSIRVFKSKGL